MYFILCYLLNDINEQVRIYDINKPKLTDVC